MLKAEYEYNYLGQQVVRKITATGQTIHNIFDLDGKRIAEYDYDDATNTSTLIREYIWANGVVIAVVENDQVYYVRTDHIGRPVFATDGAGAKVWEASYKPFGGVDVTLGGAIDLRFPGQWFQAESGLHQNWMRDYDPTTGRYVQADPLGLVDGSSVYGYAMQSPNMYVDPRGENVWVLPRPIPIPRPTFRPNPLTTPFPRPVPPLTFPRSGDTYDKPVDDSRADEQHNRYKAYCDNPPPSGNSCADLKARADYHFKCANMKEAWDNRWKKGRHKDEIGARRKQAQKLMSEYYRRCLDGQQACTENEDIVDQILAGLN